MVRTFFLRLWRLAALLVCILATPGAQAIVFTTTTGGFVRVTPANSPAALTGGDMSVFLWVRVNSAPAGEAALWDAPGTCAMWLGADGLLRGSVTALGGTATATAGAGIPVGDWTLLALTYTKATGTVTIWAHSTSGGALSATATNPAIANQNLGALTGNFGFGQGSRTGLLAGYGLFAVRNHALAAGDSAAVFNSRRYFAPYDLVTTGASGAMNGINGCQWMLNHCLSTSPTDGGVGGYSALRAAWVNSKARNSNTHVFNRAIAASSEYEAMHIVRPALVGANNTRYTTFREGIYAGFFQTDVPPNTAGVPTSPLPAVAPKARRIATGDVGLTRVMVSANSRAVRINDGSDLSPGNYAQGFLDELRSRVAGVLFRPAVDGNLRPWFGFNTKDSAPFISGTVMSIESTNTGWHDAGRFWTGGGSEAPVGPGAGLILLPGSAYALLCGPESGSKVLADQPLDISTYVLRFPGSSDVSWQRQRGSAQGLSGVLDGSPQSLALDSTVLARTLAAGEAASTTALSLFSDLSSNIHINDACFVASGAGLGSISLVSAISFDGTRTTITLEHPLSVAPATGDTVKFGPWSFEVLNDSFAAVASGDANTWRGSRLTASATGAGLVVFSHSAVRPGVAGLVFGSAGWGGNGYANQIADSFDAAIPAWMALTAADAWIVVPAQQNSTPTSMNAWSALIRSALPAADLVWAGEGAHPHQIYTDWFTHIATNADDVGAVGINAWLDPRIGDANEQWADGHRSNVGHLSARGNVMLARVWIEQIGIAALASAPDADGDGTPDASDGCPNDPGKVSPGICGCGTPDTDSDGDGTPNCNDGCPNDAAKIAPGACGCGSPDVDTDGDSVLDCNDGCPTDPAKTAAGACGCGVPDIDTDNDGTPDCNDACPNDPAKTSAGQCGCGNAETDSDNDGTADCVDGCPSDPAKSAPAQCGCGFPETDTDSDGVADCVDGCPNDPGKSSPGACGCGTPDTDTDNDGTPDCNDECPADPAKTAAGACGCGTPESNCPDLCADRGVLDLGVYSVSTLNATTDGPSSPSLPGDGQVYNDIWFEFTSTSDQTVRVSLCDTSFGSRLAVYGGAGCTDLASRLSASSDDPCDSGSPITLLMLSGQTVVIRVGGDSSSDRGPATLTLAFVPPPPEPLIAMVFATATTVPTLGTVQNEDVVTRDPETGEWAMLMDGSDLGLGSLTIDALARLGDGSLIMSFTTDAAVPGVIGGPNGTLVDDADLVRFIPTLLGPTTAGSLEFYFDGSDVFLNEADTNEDIDAVMVDSNGDLLISVLGSTDAILPKPQDEDFIRFVPGSLGAATTGAWSVAFDGSDVDLGTASSEDVDAAAIRSDGNWLLSTVGAAAVPGLNFSDEDVVRFAPTSLGSVTTGTYTMELSLVPLGIDPSENINALELIPVVESLQESRVPGGAIDPWSLTPVVDIDASGVVDENDYILFLDKFFRGQADFDKDGETTPQDLHDYVDAWLDARALP